MRLYELLFLITIALTLLYNLQIVRKSLVADDFLVLFSFVFFISHLLTEGTRWQLTGAYLLLFFFFIHLIYIHLNRIDFSKFHFRKSIGIIISVLLIFSVLSSIVFPVYVMKTPSGNQKVGTRVYEAVDYDRNENYGSEKGSFRKLKYQIWYPADNISGIERTPWLYEGVEVSKGISRMLGFPVFTLNQTKYIMSHSYLNAPLSRVKKKYPVIVLSHGWNGFRSLHADFTETLASNGFVVVSIDHTYGSAVTVFENGEIRYNDKSALDETDSEEVFIKSANLLVDTYSKDISFILDELERVNQNDLNFKNAFDLENIGIAGHSTGGGADVLTAINDERVKSVFGLDPWVEPIKYEDIETGITIPAFFLRSEEWENSSNNENLYELLSNSSNVFGLYQVNGTYHIDFSMSYVFSPISKLIGKSGSLKSKISIQLQNDLILDFFMQTLVNHNQQMSVLQNYSDYLLKIEGGE